jgi:aryl-alcohol dehydrogenase-like predicted oxidoreductase
MSKRNLGQSGLKVSTLCLGGNVFGWTADEATSHRILDVYTDAGLNFIDTADVYSAWAPGNKGGESETIIGNWFKKSGKRERVVLATKVGHSVLQDRRDPAFVSQLVRQKIYRQLPADCEWDTSDFGAEEGTRTRGYRQLFPFQQDTAIH